MVVQFLLNISCFAGSWAEAERLPGYGVGGTRLPNQSVCISASSLHQSSESHCSKENTAGLWHVLLLHSRSMKKRVCRGKSFLLTWGPSVWWSAWFTAKLWSSGKDDLIVIKNNRPTNDVSLAMEWNTWHTRWDFLSEISPAYPLNIDNMLRGVKSHANKHKRPKTICIEAPR